MTNIKDITKKFLLAAVLVLGTGARGYSQTLIKPDLSTPNISAPFYQPDEWDDAAMARLPEPSTGSIKEYLGRYIITPNCYAYATNAPAALGPGRSVGVSQDLLPDRSPGQGEREALIVGAKFDGLLYIGKEPQLKPNTYLIAFYIAPAAPLIKSDSDASDYHFVRQDRNGGWSHKPGTSPPRRMDSDGKIITDPAEAVIKIPQDGRRYEFVGYFLVPEGGLGSQGLPRSLLAKTGVDLLRPAVGKLNPDETIVARFTRFKDRHTLYLRKNQKGKWAYSPQYLASTETDDRGRIITDPRNAYFKGYTFSGFFVAPNSHPSRLTASRTKLPSPRELSPK